MDKEKFDNSTKTDLEKLRADLDALAVAEKVDLHTARRRVNRRIGYSPAYIAVVALQRIAAVLFLPLLACTLWIYFDRDVLEPSPSMLELHTSAGMIGRVELPDSSVVVLNAGSVLSYPSSFGRDERRIELYGEAYLEVSKDSARRFVVGIPGGNEIAVYGTHFNVAAYKDEPCIATLVEGSIGYRYSGKCGEMHEVKLEPHQRLRHNSSDGSLEISATDCCSETAWKDGHILLDRTSLDEILHIVGRKYQVKFQIRNKNLASYTFSGGRVSMDDGLERILETLRISSGIRWSYKDKAGDTTSEIVIY